MSHNKVQVDKGYYQKQKYNTLERFISYYFQVDEVLGSKGKHVLEIGMGSNIVSLYLKTCGLSVTTCDFDEHVHPDVVADIRDIPLSDKSFDTVLACQVLEHIPYEDFDKALHELRRIARTRVIISVPYRSTFFEVVLKFPFIRTLLHKNFLDLTLRIPLIFAGFKSSGQHYWEIDIRRYRKSIVKNSLRKHFKIIKEFSPPLNKFHYFFVLEPLPIDAERIDSKFVQDTYNSFLTTLSETYGYYRWQRTPVSRFHHAQTKRVLEYTMKKIGRKGSVLEVGGGDGEWTPLFLRYADKLDFVDISHEMIKRAQERLSSESSTIRYIEGDILDTPLDKHVYSVIGAIRNLEYMPDKEGVLRKYFTILEDGGLLYLITKNPETDFKGYFNKKKLHSGQIKIKDLEKLLQRVGFTHIEMYPAIIGKKINYALFRYIWHIVQHICIRLPHIMVPSYFLRLFSESFLIIAKK